MRLLAISTSTPRGSAAVLDGEHVLGASTYVDLEGHAAERIFQAVHQALEAAGLSSRHVEAFAVDIGPGSFTGVRVGVSAGKGMAMGRGAPLVGVGSLEVMARAAFRSGAAGPRDVVVAAIDARKQELFLAGFAAGGEMVWAPRHVPTVEAAALLQRELGAELGEGRLRLVGEVAAQDPALAAIVLRGPALDLPDAAELGRMAAERLLGGGNFDPEIVEPLYVRAPDAKPMASGTVS